MEATLSHTKLISFLVINFWVLKNLIYLKQVTSKVGSELQKLGKRRIKVLAALLSLSIILSSFLTQRAYGTIEKEYEYYEAPLGTKLYEFRVKVVIETEKDGTWKTGTEYEVYFTIILDYINRNFIESMTFYDAQLFGVAERSSYPSNITFCYCYPKRAVFRLLVKSFIEGRTMVYPLFRINITYRDGNRMYTSWNGGDEPIYIYEYEAPRTLEPLEPLSMMVIGVAIGVVISAASIMLGIKIGEKRAEKKKANP